MTTEIDPTKTPDPSKQALTSVIAALVGEGKKFKSVEDLATGKLESDAFIDKLKDENKELRTLLGDAITRISSVENKQKFLEGLRSDDNNDGNRSDPTGGDDKNKGNQPSKSLSADDVIRLVEQREATRIQEANVQEVDAVLIKSFGAEAKAFIAQKAEELGLSDMDLKSLAQRSPKAFFSTFGISPTNVTRNASLSSLQNGSSTLNTNQQGTRNHAYYKKLTKDMGAYKFAQDATIQVQMHKDMRAQGDSFFTT